MAGMKDIAEKAGVFRVRSNPPSVKSKTRKRRFTGSGFWTVRQNCRIAESAYELEFRVIVRESTIHFMPAPK